MFLKRREIQQEHLIQQELFGPIKHVNLDGMFKEFSLLDAMDLISIQLV